MASNYDSDTLKPNSISIKKNNELKYFYLEPLSSKGPKVAYHAACVFNDSLYIHGGLMNTNDKMPSNQLFKFDLKSGWKDITPINSPALSNHSAVVQANCIILIGGWNGSNRTSDVYVYDIIKNQIQKAKTSGSHTCNNLLDDSILIFGREGSLRIQRKHGNCFLLKGSTTSLSYTYEAIEVETASRSGHVTLNIDKNHILVIGGRKDKVVEMHSFPTDFKTSNKSDKISTYLESLIKELKSLKNTPGGRRFAAAAQIGDFCLIHSGETFDSHFRVPQQDLLLLQLSTMKWFSLGDIGIHLQNQTMSYLNGSLIVHGGLGLKNKMNEITFMLRLNES